MNAVFPARPLAHQLEERSRRFLIAHLPGNWTQEVIAPDYGVDLRIDIFEGQAATGLELLVQLKASAGATAGTTEVMTLETTTYHLLDEKLQVVILIKYSAADDEAYWLLFRDAKRPRPGSQTVSIRISKQNRISTLDWIEIQNHVRDVTDEKRAATRRQELALGR